MNVPFSHRLASLMSASVAPFDQLHQGTHWLWDAISNDPEITYGFNNQYALRSLGNPSFASPFTQMNMNVRDLPPDRLATLLSVLSGYRGTPPDRMSNPDLMMLGLRGLNPQNIRAYGG